MKIEEFINNCLEAIGKELSLQTIFSLYSKIDRKTLLEDNILQQYQLDIYRLQGGRIRIEKHFQEQKIITIINGLDAIERTEVLVEKSPILINTISLNQQQIMEIKRSVRLYPRNFLAHISEYQCDFKGLEVIDNISLYAIDFLAEEVTYYFDPDTFFCLSLIDSKQNSKVFYSDYRNVNNIFTPFEEKTILENQTQIDKLKTIEHNLKLPDELFLIKY